VNEDNQLLTDIDVGSNRFCLAGAVRGVDSSDLPMREVRFEYDSDGSIKAENLKRVRGEFSSVNLRLVIEELGSPVYQASVSSACTLKGWINKAGEQGKSRLKCKLGDGMADLGLASPSNSEFRDNVESAFPKQKNINVDVDKGKLKVNVNGEPAGMGVEIIAVGCDED
jgi:hypothetical protein